ncbi:MAG TPA: hypothetical protein PKO15_07275 [Fibrobacteria bacterium]|nr:hypothetical protein [Fibrobacteria bacterium]
MGFPSSVALAIASLACGAIAASPEQAPVRLVVRDTFRHRDTLALTSTTLDSLASIHPYLSPDSLATLDPDTAWARHLRSDSSGQVQACENCQDDFFQTAALSLSRRHAGHQTERRRMQEAFYELDRLLSCLDGGGSGHVHQVSRIPLYAEHALERANRTGFQASAPRRRDSLEAWIRIVRPERTEDPDAPETHLDHCQESLRYRLPDAPWIREQAFRMLGSF